VTRGHCKQNPANNRPNYSTAIPRGCCCPKNLTTLRHTYRIVRATWRCLALEGY